MYSFPVTESTLSATHLGRFLQARYSLSPHTECKLFRTGMNHLYMVSDGNMRYVLRIYTHHWRTQLDVAEELRLLLHLKEHNIPVAYPLPDLNGAYIQEMDAPEGTRYAVLFSYAEGKKEPKFSAETAYHIGVAIARLHQAAENFHLERVTYNARTLLTDSLARTKAFFSQPSEEMAFVEQLTSYLQKEYEKINRGQIRHGAVHLDLWFDNMHIQGQDKISFFDFDFCGNGWLCLDVSYFLYQLYNTNLDEKEYWPKAESLLEGYESISPLSEEEKRILPISCLYIMLFYLSMQCDRYDTWSNIFLNEDHLKRYVGALKRWMSFKGIVMDNYSGGITVES